MSYPYHMQQWDQWQHRSAMHRLERERREAVAAYVRQHQSNTPEGASGCRQAVVSHEARAVAARGSLAQKVAGNSSALAAVSTTAAAPENPRYRVANPACGARCRPWVFQAAEVVLKLNNDFKPQAEALPDPLIPSPIDLRQFAYFPVDLTHPSFGELVLIKSDAVFRAVVSLISWSITRVPAGCFPADMVPRLSRVAACFRCNRSKGKKPLSAWLLL